MSDLLEKYKNVSPSPKQITAGQFDQMRSRLKTIRRIQLADKIKTYTLYACGAAAVLFTAYNMHEYNKSFDNCQRLLESIEINTAILDQEIDTLNKQMAGAVDYE